MASGILKEELNCSICQEIFTDPVTLQCGHSFCIKCISQTWDKQEEKESSCPECRHRYKRRPELRRNHRLSNIVEQFSLVQTPQEKHKIFCTYCINSHVPATTSCLLCEVSLCENHLSVHSRSPEHVLTDTNTFLDTKKCSSHKKSLMFYCLNDGAFICVSCWMFGEHKGHKAEQLSEASKIKKLELRHILEKLNLEKQETGKRVEILKEHREEVREIAISETRRVPGLFHTIREMLEVLEKQILSNIAKQQIQLSFQISDSIHKLQLKERTLSEKIHHIEELCNSDNPVMVLQDEESDGAAMIWAEMRENDGGESEGLNAPVLGDLDVYPISELLYNGLGDIFTEVTSKKMSRSKSLQNNLTYGITKLSSHKNDSRPHSNSLWNSCLSTEKLWTKEESQSLGFIRKTERGTTFDALANEPSDFFKNAKMAGTNRERKRMENPTSLVDMTTTSSKASLGCDKKTHFRISPRKFWNKMSTSKMDGEN